MAGVTDRPFRILCRRFGAGLAASEMLSADVRLWDTPKSRRRMDHRANPVRAWCRLPALIPQMMADAARRNVDAGAEIIDINMGCPAKKVCNRLAGSALLQDEALVARDFALRGEAVAAPVTLKTRTGWDRCTKMARESQKSPRIAAFRRSPSMVAPARTCIRAMPNTKPCAPSKQSVRIPVFANGDIDSPQRARQILDVTGCDGIMIGRAAQGRPWIFDEVNFFLATGKLRAGASAGKSP